MNYPILSLKEAKRLGLCRVCRRPAKNRLRRLSARGPCIHRLDKFIVDYFIHTSCSQFLTKSGKYTTRKEYDSATK